ncbi:AraC family transcriptional regulator [Thiobacillus sp.]|uniref:AraC family transcriptional regulator n=1 Tax=Thiobacillus sp. TaxID=924 RepID=UPI0011D778B4|nr:AraC family transcriptional regulator [Thiobacillus sp.]TXH75728.1 MAG: AraC family transcriptional regulator [Thiobacillus sp.]
MNVFNDIVDTLRVRGTLYFRTQFAAPWSVLVPAYGNVARFHLVTGGHCWVRIEGLSDAIHIEEGDMIMIPRGSQHVLSDTPDRVPVEVDTVVKQSGFDGHGALVYSAADDPTPAGGSMLICGHLEFDNGLGHPLLTDLPPYLLIRTRDTMNHLWIADTLRFIVNETHHEMQGADAVVNRLSEILYIQLARACLDHARNELPFVAALKDTYLTRALSALHAEPGRDWTVEGLADIAGLSRARFAARFQKYVGKGPIAYLTEWRMLKATQWLRHTDKPIKVIASKLGYGSEQSFSRAFSQHYTDSPRRYRASAHS